MRQISRIIVHCSATPNGRPHTALDIDGWHRAAGFKRSEGWVRIYNSHLLHIGYHDVIRLDGTVEHGRHLDENGAHAANHNRDTIGICMIGMDRFTEAQWDALEGRIFHHWKQYPDALILGHRDLQNVAKSCPGFDTRAWVRMGMMIPERHLLGGYSLKV